MGSPVSGTALSCREAAAAMAMVTARTESAHEIIGFTSGGSNGFARRSSRWGGEDGVSKLNISPKHTLDQVVRYTECLDFGGTDCALPILYAAQNDLKVDTFVVYTDSETWAGSIHPVQALKAYRKQFNPQAKLIVVGMNSNEFSIADPDDAGMLDVVGFDTSAPRVISDFSKGAI